MKQNILIVCSVIPPFKDAVGENAVKIKNLLTENGFICSIITSIDQKGDSGVFTLIKTWGLQSLIKIIKCAKNEAITQIIFEYPSPYYKRNIFIGLLPLVCKVFKLNITTYLHEYYNYSKIGKLRIFPILLFSDAILTTDKINYDQLIAKNYLSKSEVSLLSVGSNFRDELFIKSQISLNKNRDDLGKLNILYFGYIMDGKGLENYFSFAEKDNSDNFQFHIIGSLPENPNPIAKKLFDKISKSSVIKYLGFVPEDELIKNFDSIDIVYLPYEGGVTERRTSFMTVMGFGKIVITTKPKIEINGLIEGENVFFIDDLSSKSFNSIITKVKALDDSKIKKIKDQAHKWYMNNYSDEPFMNKFLSILNKT